MTIKRPGPPVWILPALALVLQGCVFANIDLQPEKKPYTETLVRAGSGGKVALIDVTGVISNEPPPRFLLGGSSESMMKKVVDQLQLAGSDPDVTAVVLAIDSPGGSVTASDILYREVRRLRDRGKVVVASLMDTAASGGLYLAVGCDRIVAHPTTLTGSIGVILQTYDLSGLLDKVGVKVTPIKSAARKDIVSPFRPMTDKEREILKEMVDELYEVFLARILEGRPKLTMPALKRIADGRVFSGTKAKSYGLVDDIGYLDDALALAGKLGGAPGASVVRYHRPAEAIDSIYSRRAAGERSELDLGLALARVLGPVRPGLYYLWAPGNAGR